MDSTKTKYLTFPTHIYIYFSPLQVLIRSNPGIRGGSAIFPTDDDFYDYLDGVDLINRFSSSAAFKKIPLKVINTRFRDWLLKATGELF